jgi:hypothetical protein
VSSDIVLQPGQVLLEGWHVEFTGKNRVHRPAEEWIECRIVKMYHNTIYGGANGVGRTVDEARLEAVLGMARAICDDVTAFDHDADEIFKDEMLHWFANTIKEQQENLDDDEEITPKALKRGQRRINLLEELLAMWQEDHDYWPDTETEATSQGRVAARAAEIREHTARRRAASARLSVLAAQARTDVKQPAGSPD